MYVNTYRRWLSVGSTHVACCLFARIVLHAPAFSLNNLKSAGGLRPPCTKILLTITLKNL